MELAALDLGPVGSTLAPPGDHDFASASSLVSDLDFMSAASLPSDHELEDMLLVGDVLVEQGLPLELDNLFAALQKWTGASIGLAELQAHPLFAVLTQLMANVRTAIYEPHANVAEFFAQFDAGLRTAVTRHPLQLRADGQATMHPNVLLDNFVFTSLGIYRALLVEVQVLNTHSNMHWNAAPPRPGSQPRASRKRRCSHYPDEEDDDDDGTVHGSADGSLPDDDAPYVPTRPAADRPRKRNCALPSHAVDLLKQVRI